MLSIREAIVVEGKYDVIRLRSAVDALIVATDGFRIFRDREMLTYLRRLAAERGLVLLTDSDAAGFVIRDYLSGAIPPAQIKHAYIPEMAGKERRKAAPSKEGLLGVEGMDGALLEEVLRRAGATVLETGSPTPRKAGLTKADLVEAGLSGGADSADRRRRFLSAAGLPGKLSANRLLEAVNATMTREEFTGLLETIRK